MQAMDHKLGVIDREICEPEVNGQHGKVAAT